MANRLLLMHALFKLSGYHYKKACSKFSSNDVYSSRFQFIVDFFFTVQIANTLRLARSD